MVSIRSLSVVAVILTILSGVLGWQVYSMRQAASGEVGRLRADLAQERQAGIRANRTYLDVSRERVWHIRVKRGITITEVVLAVAPQVNGVGVKVAAGLQYPAFGNPQSVRVLTTAPNWGADDKVLPTTGGVVRVQYQFPLAVTEATISLER